MHCCKFAVDPNSTVFIIVRTISGICHWVFRVKAICTVLIRIKVAEWSVFEQLLRSFAMSSAMNKYSFINLPGFSILLGSFFQILWCILTIDTKLYPCT